MSLALPATAPAAEGLFAPRVIVNDRAITNYEIDQRAKFLAALQAPGDLQQLAEKQLIQDRLQMQAATAVGIKPTDKQIADGMTEFAGRAKLTTDQFVAELAKAGIDRQTFRDFVTAGVAWRTFVQAKFGPNIQITQADLDRARALSAQRGPTRVLLSELILPATTPQYAAQSEQLAVQLSRSLRGDTAFAAAARKYSVSGSAPKGGQLDWIPLANLPPQLQQMILQLAPGQVSAPVRLQNAIGLFELRSLQQSNSFAPAKVSVEYAQYLLPGGDSAAAQATAAKIRARVDTCNDLYGVANGQPEDRLTITTQTMARVPARIGLELAKLDAGESTTLARGNDLVFLMLCHRTEAQDKPPTDAELHQQLLNQRLNAIADNYLAELQADAIIRRP
ncbi:peptidylprolyl isomerase [Acidimangrovimonas pyrenivorans]|uniref:Parvulin-like PPIase n=1 Tax=Acidimangrovimonas pyrenivorans TaxID=2030798 RepID=A0ABV7AC03_9RHOB